MVTSGAVLDIQQTKLHWVQIVGNQTKCYLNHYPSLLRFCKVAPEELHDREDDGDSNDDDDDIYILTMCLSRKIITSTNCTKTMFEICSEMFQQLFDK